MSEFLIILNIIVLISCQFGFYMLINEIKKLNNYLRELEDKKNPKKIENTKLNLKEIIDNMERGCFLDISKTNKEGNCLNKRTFRKSFPNNWKRLSMDWNDILFKVVYLSSSESSIGVKNFLINYVNFESAKIEQIVTAIKGGETVNINRAKSPTLSPLVSPRRKKATSDESDDEDAFP